MLAGWATGQVHVACFDGETWRIEIAIETDAVPPMVVVEPPDGWQPLPDTEALRRPRTKPMYELDEMNKSEEGR